MKIGIKGISYSATERKYLVRVIRDSKRVYLGRYSSLEEAKQALNQEENKEDIPEELPILSSLRAEFSAKKPNNKSKKVSVGNPTPKPAVFILNNSSKKTPSKVKSKKPEAPSKVLKDESSGIVTGDYRPRVTAPTEVEYRRSTGDQILELAIGRLLEMADERKTSVFEVIVQEVARLSKK